MVSDATLSPSPVYGLRHRIAVSALGLSAMLLVGCGSGGQSGSGLASSSTSIPRPANMSTRPSAEDEPMTPFEKRRLIAYVRQDPNAMKRLTQRERRELAAMITVANEDDDDRD